MSSVAPDSPVPIASQHRVSAFDCGEEALNAYLRKFALANHQAGYARTFVPVGDVFGGLVIPIVESAVDSLVRGELERLRTCADRRCPRHFADDTKSHTRRWCDMRTCGNQIGRAHV